MKHIKVSTFAELNDAFTKYCKSNRWIFRGQSNPEWKILPKAGRLPFKNIDDKVWFEAWKRRAIEFVKSTPTNDWDWLAIAQHHGLATRLLDWSYNPLFATFFAVSEPFDNDAIVYCYLPYWTAVTENAPPFERNKTVLFKPHGVVPRIVRQSGLFTVHHKPSIPLPEILDEKDSLECIVIKKLYREELLFELNQYGINEYSLFPDLDGLSSYMNWYMSSIKYWDGSKIFSSDEEGPNTHKLL